MNITDRIQKAIQNKSWYEVKRIEMNSELFMQLQKELGIEIPMLYSSGQFAGRYCGVNVFINNNVDFFCCK